MDFYKCFIDNEWIESSNGERIQVPGDSGPGRLRQLVGRECIPNQRAGIEQDHVFDSQGSSSGEITS